MTPNSAITDAAAIVSGIGIVTGHGIGSTALDDALAAGRSAAGPVTRFDAGRFACRVAVEVPEPALRFARGPCRMNWPG
ncbi:hypothetical protein ACFQ4K_08980 [Tistrella bauzanensis]